MESEGNGQSIFIEDVEGACSSVSLYTNCNHLFRKFLEYTNAL